MSTLRNLAILTALVLLAGCATPQTRIASNRALYDSLPAEDQALIQQGQVGVGFTPDMVRLALGEPDRIYTRTDRSGHSESWAYTSYRLDDGRRIYGGYYHSWYRWRYPFYSDFALYDREVYERTKIVFKDGRVDSIEEVSS